MDKSYIFTGEELGLLLSAVGVTNFIGFKLPDASFENRGEVGKVLFKLSSEGILIPTDSSLEMNSEVRNLLTVIKDSKEMLLLSGKDESIPQRCIYMEQETGNTTVVSPTGASNNMFKLAPVAIHNLADYLIESGFCMQDSFLDGSDTGVEGNPDNQEAHLQDILPGEPEILAEQSLTLIDTKSNRPLRIVYLIKGTLRDSIVYKEYSEGNNPEETDTTNHTVILYSRENLKQAIHRLT